jgi:8-oxo-dGTP pyrophosphatase MutT (NUDIX family)/RimJ/RimL family protein N-acetyltransferase
MITAEQRAQIRAMVAARVPVDEREAAAIPLFLEHFDALADPLSETSDPVHVTGSAILVGSRGVVLHKHKRLGLWLQPGGHIDDGELPSEAALREAIEETGIPARHPLDGVRFAHLDVHAGGRGHTHLDLRYLLIGPDVDPSPPPGESPETFWFGWDDAIERADPGLRGALIDVRRSCTFTVRPATEDDGAAVAEVYLRSLRIALPRISSFHSDESIRAWVVEHIMQENEIWVGIDGHGRVVGMLGLGPPDPTADDTIHAWIQYLYLDPSVIGLGLGERFIELAKDHFTEGLQLWAFQVNEAAQRFYARHGFVEVERTDGANNDEREPDVRMVWR